MLVLVISLNRNIIKIEADHRKFWLPMTQSEAHVDHEMHSQKSRGDRSLKGCFAAQKEMHSTPRLYYP